MQGQQSNDAVAGGVPEQDDAVAYRPAPKRPGRVTRRRLLGLGAVGALAAGGFAVSRLARPTAGGPTSAGPSGVGAAGGHDLDAFADNVQSGGPPPDGIPSIDAPTYVSAGEADFLDAEDVVFGLVVEGRPRAYPQLVLVWHEIVNDTDAGGPVSVTYCPLTGSVVGFRPAAGIQEFGTSGSLVNSNLLMYDRTHNSTWPQILGQAISGPQRGVVLEEFPLEWTTWQRWREAFPDTDVLSFETGFVRRYGEDPYGSYNPPGGYYAPGSRRLFPVMATDDRFDAKDVFLGTKLGDARLAVRKDLARSERVVAAQMDATPVVFLHDPALDSVRAFRAESAGEAVDLEPADTPGQYADRRSPAVWDAWGHPASGTDEALTRVLSYDVMWFSWVAFFPDTEVVA